ncbi:MAG: hypothetical protein AAGA73_03915 [Pseudomonadota bacterium]
MEIVGFLLAIAAALFVLIHARTRHLPFWSIVGWVVGTFLLMIVVLPIYLLIHGPAPKGRRDRRSEDR